MTFLPIVARELRVAARRRSTYLGRVGAAFVAIVIAGFWLPVLAEQFTTTPGKLLFGALSTLAFGYCLVAGTRVTSDCVSVEKREGTIGLLFLTDLRGYDVILGKLVSSSLTAFYGLLGIVPVLALALLLGGVTLIEVNRTALLFASTLFFSMTAGVLVSTFSRNDRRAMFATACVILLVAAGPYGVAWGSGLSQWLNAGPNSTWFLQWVDVLKASPVFAFQILRGSYMGVTSIQDFYESILTTQLISWVFLATASLAVPRVCRERPPGRLGMRWVTFRDRWSYGKSESRRAFRARLLDRNAFYWLASRDRIKAYYVWFFVLALAMIWAWSGWVLQSFIFGWDVSFWLLFLLFVFFKVWLTSEVCTRLVEDRASGAFELLLSSPLDLKEMARGQSLALWRQFGRPTAVILLITLLLLHSALLSPHSDMGEHELKLMFWSMAILLVADLVTLKWVGMWMAITRSQIHNATVASCSRVLVLPAILSLLIFALINLSQYATSGGMNQNTFTWGSACKVWLTVGLVTDLFFGLRARWQFLNHFRQVATERFAPSPGLKPFLGALRTVRQWLWPKWQMRESVAGTGRYWMKWWLTIPALALLIAWTSFAFWKQSLQRQVDTRVRTLQAAGQPVTLSALRTTGGLLDDSENAALYFQRAAANYVPPFIMARPTNGSWKLEWPGPCTPLRPESSHLLAEHIARNQKALNLLHTGAALPRSRFPIPGGNGPAGFLPWQMFGALHPIAQLLEFDALFESERGDVPRALAVVQTLLGMAKALGQEPFLTAQEFRLAYLHAAQRSLERILNHAALSPDQLETLRDSFRQAEAATGPILARALAGQRALQIDDFRFPTQSALFFGGPTPSVLQKTVRDFDSYLESLLGVRQRRFLEMIDASAGLIAHAQLIGTQDREALQGGSSTQARAHVPREAALASYWEELLKQHVGGVVRMRLAQTALAIEQFRALHDGRVPQSLDELARASLSSVPVDPFSVGPFLYRPQEKGYLIYSVGPDGQDDGGLPLPPNSNMAWIKSGFDLPFRVER